MYQKFYIVDVLEPFKGKNWSHNSQDTPSHVLSSLLVVVIGGKMID